MPEAITAFMEGSDFEDVIRTAVSLGGDCDTLTCIAGGMAEACYGIPKEIEEEGKKRLPEDMLSVVDRFRDLTDASVRDPFLEGNELIEEAIRAYHEDSSKENLCSVLKAIRERMHADGHLMVPVAFDEAFTSPAEHRKGAPSQIVSNFIDSLLKGVLETDCPGFIINPWGQDFMLARELIEMIF